jgi:hypothetical protein
VWSVCELPWHCCVLCTLRNAESATCRALESLSFSRLLHQGRCISQQALLECWLCSYFHRVRSRLIGVGHLRTGLFLTWITLGCAPDKDTVSKAWPVSHPWTRCVAAACTVSVCAAQCMGWPQEDAISHAVMLQNTSVALYGIPTVI